MQYSARKNKNEIALEGKCIVRAKADDFFGGENSSDYESGVLESPSWGDLYECAVVQQLATLDMHHDYLESFDAVSEEVINGETVCVIKLFLGS